MRAADKNKSTKVQVVAEACIEVQTTRPAQPVLFRRSHASVYQVVRRGVRGLLVAAAIITFAHLWLRRFERGPVEWLWNRTYRALAG